MTRVPAKRWQTRADLLARVDVARELLESPIGYKISIEDLAKLSMISPWHFVRLFRETYGVSPKRYASDFRLVSAKAKLEQGFKVGEVAVQVGYESLPSFSREFKRKFGVPPQACIK